MSQLRVEADRPGDPPAFLGPTDDLVYFLSFAVAERYGATHDLSGAARILREGSQQDVLRPLLAFAEDNPDDAGARGELDRLWQDPAPVAESSRWVAAAIRASRVLQELTAAFPRLPPSLDELAAIAAWWAERGARIRLLFRL